MLCVCVGTLSRSSHKSTIQNPQTQTPQTQEQPPLSADESNSSSSSIAHHALAAVAHEHLASSSSTDQDHDDDPTASNNPHAGLSRALHAHPASLRLQALLAHRVGGARARDGWAVVAGAGCVVLVVGCACVC